MRLVEFETVEKEKVILDADRVVAIESYRQPPGSAIATSGTVIYLIATNNAFVVPDTYDSVKKKVFPNG